MFFHRRLIMEMDRFNEICQLFVRDKIRNKGVETFDKKKVKKSVKRFARQLGISKAEAYEFTKILVSDALGEALDFSFKSDKKKKK